MAEAYNWARMCTKSEGFPDNQFMTDEAVARLKNLYKSIWTATLGTESGFESFFQECSTPKMVDGKPQILIDGKPVNGATFQKKLESEFARLNDGKKLNSGDFSARVGSFKSGDREIDNAMSMIATQYSRTEYINADTHMAAGFLMGIGYHLQQGCGQGKSSAVATSTLMVRGGAGEAQKQMFVTSSTPELAAQSFGDMAGYFDDLGVGQQVGKNGEFQPGSDERLFLMTDKGPKVAVRLPNGKMLTKNDVNGTQKTGFDDTQCCETEDMHFVVENGDVRLAKRVQLEGKERLGWEENSVTFDKLKELGLDKKALQVIYGNKENIIFSDNAQVVQDNMRGAIPSDVERHAIMDEGDYVKNDQFHYLQQKGEAFEGKERDFREKTRVKARKVIETLMSDPNKKDLFEHDVETQFAQFTDAGIDKVVAIWNAQNPEDKITNEIMNFIEEALVVETVFVKGTDYVVEGDKVISQAKASGTAIELPESIAQALSVKEGLAQQEEHKVYNIQTIMGAYQELFGSSQTRASGTHEAETMREAVVVANLKVAGEPNLGRVAEAPTSEAAINAYLQNTRYRTMLQNRAQVDGAIIAETEAVLQADRPVLIGCVTSQDVEEMKNKLRESRGIAAPENQAEESSAFEQWGDTRVITYTAETAQRYNEERQVLTDIEKALESNSLSPEKRDELEKQKEAVTAQLQAKYGISGKIPESFDKYVKQNGGKRNTIVLGTSIIGRGANIGIEDEPPEGLSEEKKKTYLTMNDIGGLHVITRGLHPSSVRQMVQFINRSMRGKQNGSSHEFFSPEDLKNAQPQISARLEEITKRIGELQGKGALEEREQAELKDLQVEQAEYSSALSLMESSKSKEGQTPVEYSADDVKNMLNTQEYGHTIQVDNDGNPVQPGDKSNPMESLYRDFYGAADQRNAILANKARSIEALVVSSLEALKENIINLRCDLDKRKTIATNLIPEFIGRALQVQYKANGHTQDLITKQCRDEIGVLLDMYTERAKAEAYTLDSEFKFDEGAFIQGLHGDEAKAAKRIFALSSKEASDMKKDYAIYGEDAAKSVDAAEERMIASITNLSPEELRAAYAELNPKDDKDKEIFPDDLRLAIAKGRVSYGVVMDTIKSVKNATAMQQEYGEVKGRGE